MARLAWMLLVAQLQHMVKLQPTFVRLATVAHAMNVSQPPLLVNLAIVASFSWQPNQLATLCVQTNSSKKLQAQRISAYLVLLTASPARVP